VADDVLSLTKSRVYGEFHFWRSVNWQKGSFAEERDVQDFAKAGDLYTMMPKVEVSRDELCLGFFERLSM
jgi:hypothetical protein